MKAIAAILRELAGLFVEDNRLAVAIIGLVAVAAGLFGLGVPDFVVGLTLFGGSLALLAENVLRAPAKRRPPNEPPKT
jgi:hypothetical protein